MEFSQNQRISTKSEIFAWRNHVNPQNPWNPMDSHSKLVEFPPKSPKIAFWTPKSLFAKMQQVRKVRRLQKVRILHPLAPHGHFALYFQWKWSPFGAIVVKRRPWAEKCGFGRRVRHLAKFSKKCKILNVPDTETAIPDPPLNTCTGWGPATSKHVTFIRSSSLQ